MYDGDPYCVDMLYPDYSQAPSNPDPSNKAIPVSLRLPQINLK